MNVAMVGLGKLGLPVALAIEDKGHNVVGYDIDPKVKDILETRKLPYREKGAQELLTKTNIKIKSLYDVVKESEIIFVAIQTPNKEGYEGITRTPNVKADFDYGYLKMGVDALSKVIDAIQEEKIVIIISTVLPGTIRREIKPLLNKYVKLCYNPFFVAMTQAIDDFLNPEFILFGVDDENASKKAEEFYRTINDKKKFVRMSIESAELTKMSYNTFITNKITIANTIMEISHKIPNCNCDDVMGALKLATDRIISPKYMNGGMQDSGGCLTGEDIVFTQDGAVRLEEVEAGDYVLSGDGLLHQIEEVYKRPYAGIMHKIKSRGNQESYFTPQHKVLAAKDLRKIRKDGRKDNNNGIQVGDIEEIEAQSLNENYYLVFPTINENKYTSNFKYKELGGYYLGDGGIYIDKTRNNKPYRLTFYMNNTTKLNYCYDIEKYLTDSDIKYKTVTFDKRYDIRIDNVTIANDFDNEFGHGYEDKFIPSWGLYGNLEDAKTLLKGMFRTDGSTHEHGFSYSTINYKLAYGLMLLLRKLGIACTMKYHPDRIGGDGVYHKPAYDISVLNAFYIKKLAEIIGMPIKHKMQEKTYEGTCFIRDGFFYHKVTSNELIEYSGTVYNLNVQDTHNYVTSSGTVLNCHPKDLLSLSFLSEHLGLKYNLYDNLATTRDKQTEWLADLIIENHQKTSLPIFILGYTYKKETNLTIGSAAILLKNILTEKGYTDIEMYDPYVDNGNCNLEKPSLFFIGMNHDEFKDFKFPSGSVVIDPWRYIDEQEDVEVISVGIGK